MKMTRHAGVLLALAFAAALAACASNGLTKQASEEDQRRYVERGLERGDRAASNAAPETDRRDRAPVLVEGRAVGWDELRALLGEAAGRDVVDEIVLGLMLERECRQRGIKIGSAEIDAERVLLVNTLTDGGRIASTPDEVERLVSRVRAQRGLGPKRFAELLRRNAMLRALVQDQIIISEEAIVLMHERLYGPDYPARLIVTTTAREAAEASRRVRAGEPFGEVAALLSIDPSADRGGIIDPINTADPTWPLAIRRAVAGLEVGQTSDPILLDEGYALLWLERSPDPKHVPAVFAVRDDMARAITLERERLLMQREARRLMDEADVAVLDQSLGWARESGER